MVRRCCAIAILTILALSGCEHLTEHDNGPALRRVMRTHVIRAGYVESQPSFFLARNGKASGIMVDIMNATATALHLKIVYKHQTTWSAMISVANSGRLDTVVSGIWPSRFRARYALFSDALYYSKIYAYCRAADHRFDNNIDAANDDRFKIATSGQDVAFRLVASRFPRASLLVVSRDHGPDGLFRQITLGKADLTFMDVLKAAPYVKNHPERIRQVSGVQALATFPNVILFAKDDLGLRDLINTGIEKERITGVIQAILRRYDVETAALDY